MRRLDKQHSFCMMPIDNIKALVHDRKSNIEDRRVSTRGVLNMSSLMCIEIESREEVPSISECPDSPKGK